MSGRVCVSSVEQVRDFVSYVCDVVNERGDNRLAKPRGWVNHTLDGQCPEPSSEPSKNNSSLMSAFPQHLGGQEA